MPPEPSKCGAAVSPLIIARTEVRKQVPSVFPRTRGGSAIAIQLEFHEIKGISQSRQDRQILSIFRSFDLDAPELELFLHFFLEEIHLEYVSVYNMHGVRFCPAVF